MHTKQKEKEKRDTKKDYSTNSTHYPFDFVVCFCSGADTVARAKVNARDTTQALFLAIRALWRKGSSYNLTRVRIAGKYPSKKKLIKTSF